MLIRNGDVLLYVLPAVEMLSKEGLPTLPVLTMLKLRKMLRALRRHAQDLGETRNEFLEQWAEKDEDGKLITVSRLGEDRDGNPTRITEVKFVDNNRAGFVAAQAELYAGEWEYEGPTLTLGDLGEFPLTGGLLADLGELFCDDDEAMAGKSVQEEK